MSKTTSRNKLRLVFWRWHRRLGLAALVLVAWLALSGILLNHSHELGWDRKPLHNSTLLRLYNIAPPTLNSFSAQGNYVSHLGGNYLYFNRREAGYCAPPFQGASFDAQQGIWVVACAKDLLLLSGEGEVVERIGSAFGLPVPITAFGRCQGRLCLTSQGAHYAVDIERLDWQRLRQAPKPLAHSVLPEGLAQSLLAQYYGSDISWQKLLLDLHSGQVLPLFPWLMDAAGVILLLLCASGFYMWYGGRRKKRRN